MLNDGEDENLVVDKVLNALQAINTLYEENPKFKANDSFGILTALLYYKIKDEGSKFEMFKLWILNNNIFEVQEVTADSLIEIFDKISSKELKVFVAMPYFDGDSEVIADYNEIYKSAISEINGKYGVHLSLFPIMINKGETQDQIQDIINKIQSCAIFFADITDNNANVSYEMGWARALKKKVIIVRRKGAEPPKSDYVNDTYHEYNDSARQSSLKKVIKENIIEELKKGYGLISEDEK